MHQILADAEMLGELTAGPVGEAVAGLAAGGIEDFGTQAVLAARAVDRLYRPAGFASERQRVEHLFMLYEEMRAPLQAMMKAKPKRRRTKRKPTGAAH